MFHVSRKKRWASCGGNLNAKEKAAREAEKNSEDNRPFRSNLRFKPKTCRIYPSPPPQNACIKPKPGPAGTRQNQQKPTAFDTASRVRYNSFMPCGPLYADRSRESGSWDVMGMEEELHTVQIHAELTSVVNYALQQNRLPVLRELAIENGTPHELTDLTLRICSDPPILKPFERSIRAIPAGETYLLRDAALQPDGAFLASLTERLNGELHVSLSYGEEELASLDREITALAFDEWHGSTVFPELLTAFVLPNHPAIAGINAKAAELLEKWSGNPSLNAYQTRDPNRVRMQAAAVYGALQAQNLIYAAPPASFEPVGQRVRLCEAVLEQKMGTCLDLTLLYAACLEAIGLHPLLLLQPGHIFAGVWLEELTFPEAVQDDPSLVTKRLADGVNEIAVVECTAFTAGKSTSFEDACRRAAQELSETPLDLLIDVSRARLSGIHPLPQRLPDGTLSMDRPVLTDEALTAAPEKLSEKIDVQEGESTAPTGKIAQWERGLLELSLRNTLINLRLTQRVVPILSPSVSELEDALADGSEYGIGPRPAEWSLSEEDRRNVEKLTEIGDHTALIQSEFKNKRLRSALTEAELARAIVTLYRTARTSLEENGANSLYLALGLLRWYETPESRKARYAPIVLLPVEIIRKSALKGYVIRLRDEEPQMNVTLLEMLKQDFGISVSGLEPLPEDEHGVDLRGVLTVLRKAVMDQRGWDVIESSLLGIFSFSQFVMWNDMRSRTEDLLQNKIVRSLVEGRLTWNAEPMEIGARVPETGVLLPIAADASQLYAIEAAERGESFVLHGPPGTGKSQTITAMIANALAQGKTVLFVAEKMAALSVVERRLDAIGIGPFCLELHSNKSKKRDVLDQLRAASEVTHGETSEDYQRKAARLADLRGELDGYANAMHARRASGLTLFEMIDGWERYRNAPQTISFPENFAATVTRETLEEHRMLAERLIAAARAVGHPHNHPLSSVSLSAYSHQLRGLLPDCLAAYETALERLDQTGRPLTLVLRLGAPDSFEQWTRLDAIAGTLEDWLSLPRVWAEYEHFDLAMNELAELVRHAQKAEGLAENLLVSWQESFLQQDGAALLAQWQEIEGSWFLPRALGRSRMAKQAAVFAAGTVNRETLGQSFAALAEYQRESAEKNRLLAVYGQGLAPFLPEGKTNWAAVAEKIADAVRASAKLCSQTGDPAFQRSFAARADLQPSIAAFRQAYAAVCSTGQALRELLQIRETAPEEGEWLTKQRRLCRQIGENRDSLREWTLWKHLSEEADAQGLGPMVKAYEKGLPHEDAEAAWLRALYQALAEDAIRSEPALQTFSGALFNEKVAQFRRTDRELEQLAREEIFCRLAARVPNFSREAAQSSEVGILQRAVRSGGRGVSIRRLFSQIPNLLPRLCPCMLMSPISAAQYLDPNREPFDVVIFDEASQLPTCKAAGALARGKNAVIVGDPKQMPPTAFFTGTAADEDFPEQEDLESILEDCLALNIPQTHLLWHYRSRHESLIAFSNSQFYDNRLYTFPSVNDLESKVTLVPVEGFFDRGRTRQNAAEARAIVQELSRRCHDPLCAGQSVGVVTFNIHQQNLIADLLEESCRTDEALESWAYEREEPLFIKNLENVQGDERDVILFSVGYGPDENGHVSMNFGPLNREGGWRRLNVAVSRARQEMVVFSTLRPEQIDLSRTASTGVAALKSFLAYAGGTKLPADLSPAPDHSDAGGIVETICRTLSREGFECRTRVGHSGFRVDVGVIDPQRSGTYLLGVLLDGPFYGAAKTTRDRELAQPAILEELGWELHRIWTADWWDNSERELDRLIKHVCQAAAHQTSSSQVKPQAKQLAAQAEEAEEAAPREKTELKAALPTQSETSCENGCAEPYHPAVLPEIRLSAEEYVLPKNFAELTRRFEQVLEEEAPISEALLTKRVLQSFGISRAGSRIQAYTSDVLQRMRAVSTEQDGQRFYWNQQQTPSSYRSFRTGNAGVREAREICMQEAANAVCRVLEEQIGLPQETLVRETAKLLGYPRSGSVVNAMAKTGIRFALESGRIEREPDGRLTIGR